MCPDCGFINFASRVQCAGCSFLHPYKSRRQHSAPYSVDAQSMRTSVNVIGSPPDSSRRRTERSRSPPRMSISKDPSSFDLTTILSSKRVLVLSDFFCTEGDLEIFIALRDGIRWSGHAQSPHLTGACPHPTDCTRLLERISRRVDSIFQMEGSASGEAINYYRDARAHGKNFHRDATVNYDPTAIAVIGSFGDCRTLTFRPHADPAGQSKEVSFNMRNGQGLIIGPHVNRDWVHGILRADDPGFGRISIAYWGRSRLCS